jgi:hypothetical protein
MDLVALRRVGQRPAGFELHVGHVHARPGLHRHAHDRRGAGLTLGADLCAEIALRLQERPRLGRGGSDEPGEFFVGHLRAAGDHVEPGDVEMGFEQLLERLGGLDLHAQWCCRLCRCFLFRADGRATRQRQNAQAGPRDRSARASGGGCHGGMPARAGAPPRSR